MVRGDLLVCKRVRISSNKRRSYFWRRAGGKKWKMARRRSKAYFSEGREERRVVKIPRRGSMWGERESAPLRR